MEIIETIKLALQKAAAERKKVATFHSLVLLNADRLENLDPHDFCRNVGVTDAFHIEFRKMIAAAQTLSELGYSIQKRGPLGRTAHLDNHHPSEVVQDIPPGAARRRWTLRADNQGHHHGIVHLSECPLYLELHWRLTVLDSVRRVGVFRLDLTSLLHDGYIRPEPADSHGPNVRLRIIRADDGSFYVQTNQHGPRHLLANG